MWGHSYNGRHNCNATGGLKWVENRREVWEEWKSARFQKNQLSITTLVDVFCTRSLLRHVSSPTLLVNSSTATYLVNSHFIVSILKSSIRDWFFFMPYTPNRHVGQQRVPSTSGDPLSWTWCPPRSSPSPLFPSQLSVAMWSWGDPACVSLLASNA